MTEKIASHIVSYASRRGVLEEKDRELYTFSYQILLEMLISWGSILIVGALFHRLLETVLFAAFYIPLRSYAGGYHARSFEGCYSSSLISYTVFCIIVPWIAPVISTSLLWIIVLLCCCIIFVRAPIADINKPVTEDEFFHCRKRTRAITICEICALSLLLIALADIETLLFIAFSFLQLSLLLAVARKSQGILSGHLESTKDSTD